MTSPVPDSVVFETLGVSGECDVLGAADLRERLTEQLETGRPVVVDLSEATFVDSACLGVFVGAFKDATRRGQPLVFLAPRDPSANVRRVFELAGLARVLPLVSSWQEVEQLLASDPYPDRR